MGSPAFNPNAVYSVPAFDPNGSFQAAQPPATPPAEKSLLQKAQDKFDALTTVTPEQKAGHGAIVNAAQEFGAGAIQGIGAPIAHPLDTLSAIGHTIAHPIDSAHAEVNALYDNPAKFAGNVAGGAILGEAAAPLVKPIASAVKGGAERAVLLGKTPEAAYESALKPSTTLSPADRASVIKTGLQNEIPISKGGLEKLGEHIETLNQAIKNEIASDPTRPIDPNAVATRADLAKAKFAKQVNAGGDLAAIDASKKQFLEEQGAAALPGVVDTSGSPVRFYRGINEPFDPNIVGSGHFTTNPQLASNYAMASKATILNGYLDIKNPMPWADAQTLKPEEISAAGHDGAVQVMPNGKVGRAIITRPDQFSSNPPEISAPPMKAVDAQEMKQGTYRVLSGKFGEQGSAAVEAQKALARGLKEEIATQFPEISKLNADESRLLDLQPVLERAVNRISNHQAIGIGTPIAGAAAKAVTGSGGVGVVASVLKGVLDNPGVKSRLAIAISKSSKIPIGQAMEKVTAYSSAIGATAASSQAYSSDDNPNPPTTPQP